MQSNIYTNLIMLDCGNLSVKVLGKYSDDKWLGQSGMRTESCSDEWPVAYHGTSEMNGSEIIKQGFKIEKGKRFYYGIGIYCTPNPKAALDYSDVFEFKVGLVLSLF